MKTFCLFFCFSLMAYCAHCQYFTATFENSGNDLVFKIKPNVANITSPITLFEFDIRYPSSYSLSFNNLESNTAMFPNLNIQQIAFASGGYIYQKFFHNSGTIPSATYVTGAEYTVFQVTINGSGAGIFQLITNYSSLPPAEYQYSVSNGSGSPLIDQEGTNYFYPNQQNTAPDYYLQISNFPLPLTLLSFDATATKDKVLLSWSTEKEEALSGFELQRSTDGANFTELAWLSAKGAAQQADYQYDDRSVEKGVTYYYRLKMLDENGDFEYSPVRSASVERDFQRAVLYPNPAKQVIFLEINALEAGVVPVKLFHANGALAGVWEVETAEGTQTFPLELDALQAGLYFVQMHLDGETLLEKITIFE